jgi:hypothetical protein
MVAPPETASTSISSTSPAAEKVLPGVDEEFEGGRGDAQRVARLDFLETISHNRA